MTRRAGSGETSRIAGLTYAFCVAAGTEVRKLIAGRGVFIGDRCADLADEVDMDGDRRANSLTMLVPLGLAEAKAKARCIFCGRRRDQTEPMVHARPISAAYGFLRRSVLDF